MIINSKKITVNELILNKTISQDKRYNENEILEIINKIIIDTIDKLKLMRYKVLNIKFILHQHMDIFYKELLLFL